MSLKENFYKIYDLITFGKGVKKELNGFVVKLPVRYSRFFPNNYESENFDFLKKNCEQGFVVIDIGAHIGLFSVCASQLAGSSGRVYSFEPAPATHNLLLKTISINKKKGIILPRKEGIGEKESTVFFNVSDIEGDNSNTIINYENDRKDRNLKKIEINITSIDNFVQQNNITKVDFVKIDAEGYEYRVLKGGIRTLKSFKPFIILAVHPEAIRCNGDSLEQIYDLLMDVQYNIIYQKRYITKQDFCSQALIFDVHLTLRSAEQ
ncbi:MAG TPA: FkbM family methyltransferase [Chitinophagaceae bacterium]|jgi:FkbM family methyltransferase|nr:FkbM family methyltransferase [Chitinophagaceae bacterium]